MKKPFHLGVVVGRFQPLHLGHVGIISTARAVCDRVAVLVGSSQESGTAKNPFSYEERRKMLQDVLGTGIDVYPLPDIGVGNNASWGEYVYGQVKKLSGEYPDIMVSGTEERRTDWFAGKPVAGLYLPKTTDVSATVIREHLIAGDFPAWKTYTPYQLWDAFENMRAAVIRAQEKKDTDSI